MTVNHICEITNVSRASLYRKLRKGTVDELYQKSEIFNRE